MKRIDNKEKKRGFSNFYQKHPLLMGGLIGGLIGYFVVSPIAMIVEHITHTGTENLGEHLRELLLLQSIPWSALFTILVLGIGLMYGYMQKRNRDLEKILFQTEKMASVGQLAAGVAHEINSPISNISLISERLKIKISENERISLEDLEEISVQIENATKIVSDLLDFSKTPELEYIKLNINDLIAHSLSFVKNKRKENIEIIEKYDNDIPLILGEPNQLQLVFMNLISNAYEAMPNGGRLIISTKVHDDGYIEIKFKDNGIGIPKENISKIFDPFFTTKPHEGTGLGLSICHGIIHHYNGRIEVESKINIGTTFTLVLPR
jgi:two-component system NtrC family sensor kinase